MTVRELKEILDNIPEEALDKDIGYNYPDMSCFGFIEGFELAKEDLYYYGGNDPSDLMTKEDLLMWGHEEEQIESEWIIEIHKGDPIIKI